VYGEQTFTFADMITHFMVDHDPNCMINGILLARSARPQLHRSFSNLPGINTQQVPASLCCNGLNKWSLREQGRFVNHAHFTALAGDKPAELLPGDSILQGGFSHSACLININSLPSNHQQMTGYHQTMLPEISRSSTLQSINCLVYFQCISNCISKGLVHIR